MGDSSCTENFLPKGSSSLFLNNFFLTEEILSSISLSLSLSFTPSDSIFSLYEFSAVYDSWLYWVLMIFSEAPFSFSMILI